MEKAIVVINGKEHELKFTIGFWKKIKEACGVTESNIETKLKEDFGVIAPQIIMWGSHYANPAETPTIADIEAYLDRSVMDAIEQAIINGMTKAEREMLDIAKKQRAAAIKGMTDKIEAQAGQDDGVKK